MFRPNITLMPLKRVSKVVVAVELRECGYADHLSYDEDKKKILFDGQPLDIEKDCFLFSVNYKVEVSEKAFKSALYYLATATPKQPETPVVDPESWEVDTTRPFFEGVEVIAEAEIPQEVVASSESVVEATATVYETGADVVIDENDELYIGNDEEVVEEENLDPNYWLSEEHKAEFHNEKDQDFRNRVMDVYMAQRAAKKAEESGKAEFLARALSNHGLGEDEEDDEDEDYSEGYKVKTAVYDPYYGRHFLPD